MPGKKNTIKKIGLTGGIATGKSTVSAMFKALGIPVLCADEAAHAVTLPGERAYTKIVKSFGRGIVNPNGTLDRTALAAIVFSDATRRAKLESIVHPEVRRRINLEIARLKRAREPIVVLDIPLLFETSWDVFCDATVCVVAPRESQIERLVKNRKMSRREALARIGAQMPLRDKARFADYVLKNNGTKAALQKQVVNLASELRSRFWRI